MTSERWPDEVREMAYQLWAYTCGRNAARVCAVLADEHGHEVPLRTVQHWASDGSWSDRVREDLSSIAPDLHQTIVSELILGAVESARLLRRSVGDHAGDRPDKVQVTSALALLDRAGYSPLGRVAPVQPASPPVSASLPDLSSVPIDQIEQLERDHLERLRQNFSQRLQTRRKNA